MGPWSPHEDVQLEHHVKMHMTQDGAINWDKVVHAQDGRRTLNQCQRRWNQLCKARKTARCFSSIAGPMVVLDDGSAFE